MDPVGITTDGELEFPAQDFAWNNLLSRCYGTLAGAGTVASGNGQLP
jgi:hypothetical protein